MEGVHKPSNETLALERCGNLSGLTFLPGTQSMLVLGHGGPQTFVTGTKDGTVEGANGLETQADGFGS